MLSAILAAGLTFFAAFPSTTTYQINSYGFGSGGGSNLSTSNYALEGISGEVAGQTSATSNYQVKPVFIETQQANVPKIASFDNGSGAYYNKLHFVIDQQNNPSDATYALQIATSSDFSTGVSYVKSDFTIGASLALTDYLTYAAWGGGSGSNIIGLSPNTTYYLRAKATQSKFTESGYGPSATASTVNPSLSFSVSPGNVSLGSLLAGSLVNSPTNITLTFATNAVSGGDVYINGANSSPGLYSTAANSTIPSASGDLSLLSHGFGARVTAASQSSGGPFNSVSPYAGSGDNIGIIDTSIRKIFTSSSLVTGGSGTVLLKAKSSNIDPAETDYTETITMIASATF